MAAIKKLSVLIPLFLLFTNLLLAQAKESADFILYNGNIFTLDSAMPNAGAIAVKGDKILAVGNNSDILKLKDKNTKLLDLKGKFVMPGFIDSHAHFWATGELKKNLDLSGAKNWDEVIQLVKAAVKKAKPGEWILGRGWHQEKWNKAPQPNVSGYPFHDAISKISPNNPVMLKHASGHALFANAKAMEMAGVTKNTPNPLGGNILRDKEGNPIGIFQENGMDIIENAFQIILDKRPEDVKKADDLKTIYLASKECIENGITSFQDAGSFFYQVDELKYAVDNNLLPIRLNVMLIEDNAALKTKIKDYKLLGYGNNHLTVRAIKRYMDGALGSRGAWFLEPYADMPNQTGMNVTPLLSINETAEIAIQNGFQLCIHAIGDRGNREVLNIYEKIFNKYPDKKDLRWRIEHAQHLSLQDIPRFAQLGVIAAMQTCHCTSDASFVIKRLGEKRAEEGAYVWQKLMKSGAIISNGTDSPVESVNPIKNFYSAVTRKYDKDKTFYPDQKMSRIEALKSYTINGAYASFEENLVGRISKNMLADFVVLSNDLVNCKEDDILKTKVLYTIIGGKVVYKGK